MESHRVELYIYDLSMGMAVHLSPMLLGQRVDGIWHTGIVVYNREYFFGSKGIESCNPGGTALGAPVEKKYLGDTQIPYSIFIDYLTALSQTSYTGDSYSLITHNCNHFSDEIAQFLSGKNIPHHIIDLPNVVLNSNLSGAISGLVAQLERSARPIEEEQRRVSRESSPDLSREIEEARSASKGSGVNEKPNK